MSDTRPASYFNHDNLMRVSADHLIVVMFMKSRSGAFPVALEIARQAELFAERDLESMKIYIAGFPATARGAMLALDLIHYVRGWSGTHFYAQRRMIIGDMEQAHHIESVLTCFINSCSSPDYRAHCHRTIDDPYFPIVNLILLEHIHQWFRHVTPKSDHGRFIFPCTYMLQWFQAQPTSEASIPEQIHAAGIEKFCDVCPRFKPSEFTLNPEFRGWPDD